MTISEFAEVTGCSRHLAYSLARQNKLPVPVIYLGGKRMVLGRAAVMELIDQRKPTGQQQSGYTQQPQS